MFGGSGDEGSYSEINYPFESSDVWNGWVLKVDLNGDIIRSDVFCHENVNTATEYGDITDDGYIIFNDTDAQGDTEVGVMKILSAEESTILDNELIKNKIIKTINILGQETINKNKFIN